MLVIIKGVNYRVVEVAGLENDYFDKAILYVRPEKSASSTVKIDLEARHALTKIIPRKLPISALGKRKFNLHLIVILSSVVVFTVALGILLGLFIS